MATGRVVVLILADIYAALTCSESVAVAELLLLLLSVAFTCNERVVVLVGVPVNSPEALSEKPATGVVSVHVQLPLPPVAASCCEYATFTVAVGSDVVVILTGITAASTVSVRLAVCVCGGTLESVTLKLSAAFDTACVGVPVMAPVAAFNASPAGSVPLASVHEYGVAPPVAVSMAVYAVPTCPFGSEETETLRGGIV